MFNIRIKELRESKGLSQAQLAQAIGYTQSCIAKWESGKGKLRANAIIRLIRFFGVSSDYLLGLED